MNPRMSMRICKALLATLWFGGATVLFILVFIQTIFGHYPGHEVDAWGWFLPTIMPTLSLIIGVLIIDTLGKGVKTEKVDRFLFLLSFFISMGYLIVVASTVLAQPFSKLPPWELMKQANLWLGPFQGLVSASLGAFFVKKG